MNPRMFLFAGGESGAWKVTRMETRLGPPLAEVPRLAILDAASAEAAAAFPSTTNAAWMLRGVTSNERYLTRDEKEKLIEKQEGLGRPASTRAAFIALRKNAAWWALTQDERRAVFEESSRHIAIGLRYLPAIARRLHHCRDLAEPEPFDFLTWFEFAPADAPAFDLLLTELRATPEWAYVDREIDLRLSLSMPE